MTEGRTVSSTQIQVEVVVTWVVVVLDLPQGVMAGYLPEDICRGLALLSPEAVLCIHDDKIPTQNQALPRIRDAKEGENAWYQGTDVNKDEDQPLRTGWDVQDVTWHNLASPQHCRP